MNCLTFAMNTNWDCTPTGRNSLLVHAPITLGNDGQHASFYVMEDSPGHFYLTDAHSTILHAMDHGAKITPSRIKKIASTPGAQRAKIALDGEITADGFMGDLRIALWDALRLALAVSDNEVAWAPKTQQERFTTQVAKTLKSRLPEGSVISKPKLLGISGHQIEFPLGILLPGGGVKAVQPIGVSDDHRVDWGYIYQSYGKLIDIKKAAPKELINRVVVMEEGSTQEEFGRAVTVLSEAARVVMYDDNSDFARDLLAA